MAKAFPLRFPSKSSHRALILAAERLKISANKFAVEAIAKAVKISYEVVKP